MNKIPKFITFTGIDEHTDLMKADELAQRYPIEWGVLFSGREVEGKFSGINILPDLINIAGRTSAHLCDDISKYFQEGVLPSVFNIGYFDRVQVNGYNIDYGNFDILTDHLGVDIITQSRSMVFNVEDHMKHPIYELFDCSGGHGVFPSVVPKLPGTDKLVGYAGGIGPNNVIDYLSLIKGEGTFWIDLESQIRTGDRFDLDKVERVCRQVYG